MSSSNSHLVSGLIGASVSSAVFAGLMVGRSFTSAPDQSQIPPTPSPTPPPTSETPQATASPQPMPTPPTVDVVMQAPPRVALSRSDNDYLYDLSQSVQSRELRRLSDRDRLAIGHRIADWLAAGADYWGVRRQFDAEYRNVIAGDYGFNRESYIKAATVRLAPAQIATLAPPTPEPLVIVKTQYVPTPSAPEQIPVFPSGTQVGAAATANRTPSGTRPERLATSCQDTNVSFRSPKEQL